MPEITLVTTENEKIVRVWRIMLYKKQEKEIIRILILTEGLTIGGQEKFTLRQVSHSDRKRYHFIIGYPVNGPLRPQYEALGVPLFRYPNMLDFYQRVWNGRIPVVNLLSLLASVRKIAGSIHQNNINIIQTNGIFSYVIGSIVSRLTHVPCIRIQGNFMKEIEQIHYRLFRYLPFSHWTSKYVLFLQEQIKEFHDLGVPEEKLYYIGSYGVDLDEFHPDVSGVNVRKEFDIPTNAPVVGQAGRLAINKRFDFMLNAAHLILDKCPETFFLVIGDGPERNNLENLVQKLGIEKNIIFTGFRSDMPQVVASFDIALFTMADLPGGTANWEAMASGKPIVGTNNMLIEDGKTGLNVPSDDIQAFANAIITLIRNPDLRQRMGQNARQISKERYDFVKQVIPKMQQLYEMMATGELS